MSDRDFIAQLEGYSLTTAEIHYYRPDAPSLLQLFIWTGDTEAALAYLSNLTGPAEKARKGGSE